MKTDFKVYLAGPEVFWQNASTILAEKCAICARLGMRGMPPVDNSIALDQPDHRSKAIAIYHGNLKVMRSCDAVIANITPFRGPHMDPGTAFEVGYFAAMGKPVVCYTQDPDELIDRVLAWSDSHSQDAKGAVRDRNGDLIEDFGMRENLMIESSAGLRSAGEATSTIEIGQVFTCSSGFSQAALSLADYMGSHLPAGP